MGIETLFAADVLGEALGAEALLGAGEGALTAGEFAAGAGAAVPELGIAAAPGAVAAADVAAAAAPAAEGAIYEAAAPVAEGVTTAAVPAAAAAETYPTWASISQGAFGPPVEAADWRSGLQALQEATGSAIGSAAETVLPSVTEAATPFSMEEFLGKYGKYGLPLATGVIGALQGQGLQRQARALRRELGTLPGATKAGEVGAEMVSAAQAGALPPGQEAKVQQYRKDQLAKLEQYLSRAKISDSSTAQFLRNQVEQQVANYREGLRGQYLNQGLQAMGISDAATVAAIKAGYGASQDAANLMQRYAAAASQMIPGVYRTATTPTAA